MNKQFKRGISAILSLLMVISLLPAQFALASREMPVVPVEYGTEDGLASSGFQGHVLTLREAAEADKSKYDYAIDVQAYNMDAAFAYFICMDYNPEDVTFVRRNGTAYAEGTPAIQMLYSGKVTADMLSTDAANYNEDDDGIVYLGQNLSAKLYASDDYTLTHDNGDDGNQRIIVKAAMSSAIVPADWTNDATGAKAAIENNIPSYKFPTNKLNTLYTMHFKLKDGKSINDNTFKMAYDDIEEINGSAGRYMNSDGDDLFLNEKTYLIGFPEKQMAKQSVEFTKIEDSKGTALADADVKIYEGSSAARAATLVTQGKTDVNGHFKSDAVLSVNKPYHYVISKTGYADQTADFTIAGEATLSLIHI